MQFKKLIAGVAAVAAALGGMALGTMTVNADTDTLTVPETATPSTITLNKADDADTSKSTYTAYRIAAYIDPVANADGQADFLWPEGRGQRQVGRQHSRGHRRGRQRMGRSSSCCTTPSSPKPPSTIR